MTKLFEHQKKMLSDTEKNRNAAYYADMGLGKTFVASERALSLGLPVLIICQKSKIGDWVRHMVDVAGFDTYDLTDKKERQYFTQMLNGSEMSFAGVINYDLVWRCKEYQTMSNFTLILDESSYIKNEGAKRTKFILKLNPQNVILLSGTPTGGKYEELWSQCQLLGWGISKKTFYAQYIITEKRLYGGFPIQVVMGYKNVDRLKRKLREHGAVFMTYEQAIEVSPELADIPEMAEPIQIAVPLTREYKRFKKDRIVTFNGKSLIGDTSLKKMLYMRQLAAMYNPHKWKALWELIEGTNRRIIIFYNFQVEFEIMRKHITESLKRPVSYINGSGTDLTSYKDEEDTITLVQYQAGSMGHNLQLANVTIYFSMPLSSELYEQSKARTHRIGQENICFYYHLVAENSIEESILETLKMRKDFTDELFREVDM